MGSLAVQSLGLENKRVNHNLNQRLQNKEVLIGQWISLNDPAVVEALANTGYDFLLVDGEHAPLGESELANILRGAKGGQSAVVYRVRENSESLIKMALDLGADGVMVPQINSAADAQNAVNAAKYPPLGKRGVGPWRASDYFQNFDEYVSQANEITSLMLQIESVEAVNNLDQILGIKGFDAAYIGPADLSAALGVFGQFDHPDFVTAVETIVEKCLAAEIPLGFDTSGVAHLAGLANRGFQILTLGSDIQFLIDGAKGLSAEIRQALQK